MEEIIGVAIVMEMLAVNLFSVDICCTRRYSCIKTCALLLLFTAVLTSISSRLWEPMGFMDGNALFTVIGVLYLGPLFLLYREPLLQISGILFSAWVYTLMLYCVSVRAALWFSGGTFVLRVLVVQTVLYTATVYLFIRWIKKEFLKVIHNITKENQILLQAVSLSWFGTIILVNASLIYHNSPLLKAISILSIGENAVLTYKLIVFMFKSLREVKSLQDIVYIDSLTGTLNRNKLFLDAEELIKKRREFRLVFMDLNNFKSINDKFGHQTGDKYLRDFADTTQGFLGRKDNLYRISGDEFIIISREKDKERLSKELLTYPSICGDAPFLGVSVGWADYPSERQVLDQLIALADERMYDNKQKKSFS